MINNIANNYTTNCTCKVNRSLGCSVQVSAYSVAMGCILKHPLKLKLHLLWICCTTNAQQSTINRTSEV